MVGVRFLKKVGRLKICYYTSITLTSKTKFLFLDKNTENAYRN